MDRPTTEVLAPATPFRSFWIGGFEGADHVNAAGQKLDMSVASGHYDRLERDHLDAAALGFHTLRESIGWRLAEPLPRRFDWLRLKRIARAADRAGVQVLWTLMHYGTPPDLDLHTDTLIERFAAFAAAAAREIAPLSATAPVYNLIDEIGFVAWAASETNLIGPAHADRKPGTESSLASGYEIKRRLARAVLAAVDAVRTVDPRARFLHIEPLVHVVPPRGRPELQDLADQVAAYQWQAWDLIAGLAEPELGGTLDALDLVGVNHYHSGQWEVLTEERLLWHERDPRRRPLADLLSDASARYQRPLVIAETSHFGSGRVSWLDEVAGEVERACRGGIPVEGLCLYPLVDRPDWNNPAQWHHSGLWDRADTASGKRLNLRYASAIGTWQRRLQQLAR